MALTQHQEIVAEHVVRTIGSIEGVFELGRPQTESLPMALLHVPATEFKPFHLLVTAGMSAEAMTLPDDLEAEPPTRVELVLGLPEDWPLMNPGPEHAWPVRLLADLARFPSEFSGWIGEGHTIPNGDPMVPYAASTQTACALIAPALSVPGDGQTIRLPGDAQAQLLGVVPLFPYEVDLKLKEGSAGLFERLDAHRVTEVLDPHRRSVAGELLDLLDRAHGTGAKKP